MAMTTPENEPPPRREPPEPPDLARVAELRRRLRRDQRAGGGGPAGFPVPGLRSPEEAGRRARDIGAYTIIPMMMFAGPAIGYLLGLGAERMFGGKPWPSLAGMLWGLFAAFRQIYLLLKRRAEEPSRNDER
jgi:hypothetical protein